METRGTGTLEDDTKVSKTKVDSDVQFQQGLAYVRGDSGTVDYHKALQLFNRAADQGHTGAMCAAAAIYALGARVPQRTSENIEIDPSRAYQLYSRAAAAGDVDGIFGLYKCYYSGIGVESSPTKAYEALVEAATCSHIDAQLILSCNHLEGSLCEVVDQNTRDYWLHQVYSSCYSPAHAGRPQAQFYMGEVARLSEGRFTGGKSMLEWYKLAADQGHPKASYILAELLETGEACEDKCPDYVRAVKYYRQALSKLEYIFGSVDVEAALHRCYDSAVDKLLSTDSDARTYYEASVNNNVLVRLAEWYMANTEEIKDAAERAMRCYRRAAENNCSIAQHVLANRAYEQKQWEEAAEWYAKLIATNDSTAYYRYAMCYLNRPELPNAYRIAFVWMQKAAMEANDPAAMHQLGLMYIEGRGVKKDPVLGKELLAKGGLPTQQRNH